MIGGSGLPEPPRLNTPTTLRLKETVQVTRSATAFISTNPRVCPHISVLIFHPSPITNTASYLSHSDIGDWSTRTALKTEDAFSHNLPIQRMTAPSDVTYRPLEAGRRVDCIDGHGPLDRRVDIETLTVESAIGERPLRKSC